MYRRNFLKPTVCSEKDKALKSYGICLSLLMHLKIRCSEHSCLIPVFMNRLLLLCRVHFVDLLSQKITFTNSTSDTFLVKLSALVSSEMYTKY